MAKAEAAADAALKHLEVTAENIIKALAEMGLAHKALAKFLRADANGRLYYNFAGATVEELAAIQPMIQELSVEEIGSQGDDDEDAVVITKSRVKFVERKGVLELLGRWKKLKVWSDRMELTGGADFIARLEAGRQRAAAER